MITTRRPVRKELSGQGKGRRCNQRGSTNDIIGYVDGVLRAGWDTDCITVFSGTDSTTYTGKKIQK